LKKLTDGYGDIKLLLPLVVGGNRNKKFLLYIGHIATLFIPISG
jgi:hypothetical protein